MIITAHKAKGKTWDDLLGSPTVLTDRQREMCANMAGVIMRITNIYPKPIKD